MTSPEFLYFLVFAAALILSLVLTPAARAAAFVLDIFDRPITQVKTHKEPVPYLGGVAIFIAFTFALLWLRVLTSFPTGTLRAIRGVLCGAALMFIVGLIDDVRYGGLHYRTKFMLQILAALMLMAFGIRIRFVEPWWLAGILTIVWIVGVTNAFNLIDIMDGLSSGVAIVASLSFLLISLPTEQLYVNFTAAAVLGAALGFFPYNLSRRYKIFMGDSGSLTLGFVASALSLGTSYSGKTDLGVFAPIMILALPIFDTLLVFYLRLSRGQSPFLGSKDHYALRLETLGWKRPAILVFSLGLSAALGMAAFVISNSETQRAMAVYAAFITLAALTVYVLRVKIL